ncbi:MAG: universal stress protein [Deltaproteobacteria bacterium]|nr:universal stress protein [Deltaproteobacteria bacterium]
MHKEIYVPFDNSEHSLGALELACLLARQNDGTVVGSHVYAAKLHDWRFRALESGLPEQFQKEQELERQRVIHDSLITSGLELITDSYLKVMEARTSRASVPFRAVSLEGRNWEALVDDIKGQPYDLVVMGAHGLGRTESALVGTVCERVSRRISTDLIVVRHLQGTNGNAQDDGRAPVAVCLDGSNRSWAALETGMELAQKSKRPLVALSAFDPYFHYTLFDSLKTALTNEAQEVFKFEQQEQLHEEIIDSGLARIYRSHLDVAERLAADRGIEITTRLLDGKPIECLLKYSREEKPWLLIAGRTGIHGGENIDLGGVAEGLLRQGAANLMLVARSTTPPDEYVADATTAWSEEGKAMLAKAPASVRGVAMAAIQRFAVAEGYTMITADVVSRALEEILPPQARIAMGISRAEPARVSDDDLLDLSYICPSCGYRHPRRRPEVCPVCNGAGSLFRVQSGRGGATGDSTPEQPGENRETEALETLDGSVLNWQRGALKLLEAVPDPFLSRRARHRIEKRARSRHLDYVSEEFARETLDAPEGSGEKAGEQAGGQAGLQAGGLSAGAGQGDIPGNWTPEGWARLLKAPEGFMRDKARAAIEDYARQQDCGNITLEVAEAGMARAREKMMEELDR